MFSLNKIFVVGNLVKDVEALKTENGTDLAKLTLAVNRYIGKNDDGSKKTEPSFIKVVVFGKTNAVKDLKKGDSLGVEGYLKNAAYEKDGVKHNYYELVGTDFVLGQKMSNRNSVLLAGNVVETPELKTTTSGKPFSRIRLAVNKYAGKDENGNTKTETLFVDVTLFGKQAEIVSQHAKKGDTIYVDGVVRVRSYEKDGLKSTYTDILVNRIQFVSSKKVDLPSTDDTANDTFNDEDVPF